MAIGGLILAVSSLAGLVLWFNGRRNRTIGKLQNANDQLNDAAKRSEQANQVEAGIDLLSPAARRDKLRDDWTR